MNEFILRYISLPPAVKGLTVQDEAGDYNVYIHARHTHETNVETLQHEIKHIESKDFVSLEHVQDIEKKQKE